MSEYVSLSVARLLRAKLAEAAVHLRAAGAGSSEFFSDVEKAVSAFDQESAASREPSLMLVCLSSGGIMDSLTKGKPPYAEVEMLDCQNGDAGDVFDFALKWKPLLDRYFDGDIPKYIFIAGDGDWIVRGEAEDGREVIADAMFDINGRLLLLNPSIRKADGSDVFVSGEWSDFGGVTAIGPADGSAEGMPIPEHLRTEILREILKSSSVGKSQVLLGAPGRELKEFLDQGAPDVPRVVRESCGG